MFYIFMFVLLLGAGLVAAFGKTPGLSEFNAKGKRAINGLVAVICFGIAIFTLMGTSIVYVGADQLAVKRQVYGFGGQLEEGRIIAINGENGYQADIIAPGFHFVPFINVINDVEYFPVLEVPGGHYAMLEARDGLDLPEGAIMAPEWPTASFNQMLDARYFLTEGNGYKGRQVTVLRPGVYRINPYLFTATIGTSTSTITWSHNGERTSQTTLRTTETEVPQGFVGVVRSNVSNGNVTCTTEDVSVNPGNDSALTVPLVNRGCRGIWNEVLRPGAYFMNAAAYNVELIDTRVQAWEYKGGFTRRIVNLTVNDDGSINQREVSNEEPVLNSYADSAVICRVEGWDIPLELRAVIQIDPENAPIIVGSVGNISEVENRLISPVLRSEVRNVCGSQFTQESGVDEEGNPVYTTRPTQVLDLVNNRPAMEASVEALMREAGANAGIEIREIRFGEPAIPPEILLAPRLERLSQELRTAYEQQQLAQEQRQEVTRAAALADEQPRLVAAEITRQEQEYLGQGQRAFLEQQAAGQRAQANVLGPDRTTQIRQLEMVLNTLGENPELLNNIPNPEILVIGSEGLESASAILGRSLGNNESRD